MFWCFVYSISSRLSLNFLAFISYLKDMLLHLPFFLERNVDDYDSHEYNKLLRAWANQPPPPYHPSRIRAKKSSTSVAVNKSIFLWHTQYTHEDPISLFGVNTCKVNAEAA